MVPAFDAMMWETEVDEVSKPFRSKFGWHIMRVEGKRSQDMSDEMATRIASNFIYQRKFEEELGAWLQKIRDEAYVDIK
jgi:peptidyl-prolyl cis-trans isomerase SurA